MDKTFRDYIRMCRAVEGCCGCPMWEECGGESCVDWIYDHPDHAEEIIVSGRKNIPRRRINRISWSGSPKPTCAIAVLPSCLVKVRGSTIVRICVFAIAMAAGTDRLRRAKNGVDKRQGQTAGAWNRKVLVFVPHEHGGIIDMARYLGENGWDFVSWKIFDSGVTHWLPLPEPPKEGAE